MSVIEEPNLSLCIPRVQLNVKYPLIKKAIDDLQLGLIDRIDIVRKTNKQGEQFNRVFIHLKEWYNNSNALLAQERFNLGQDIKVIYDSPWFWKISLSREPKPKGSNYQKI